MKEKKSFLLHIDSLDILEKLSDEQAGKLFKAIASHHNGSDYELDNLLDLVFTPFKNQFLRESEKYKEVSKIRALNGRKGGKQKQANLAKASKSKQNLANLADKDNESDKDSDSDKDINTLVTATPDKKKFNFNQDHYAFAKAMADKIKIVAPAMKSANLNSWANTIRLLCENDNVEINHAWNVFKWANSDSFWQTNILSADKFRKQFAQLSAKMPKQQPQRTIKDFEV